MATAKASAGDAASDISEIVVLPRFKRPPLRFRGRQMASFWTMFQNQPFEIALWDKKDGVVVAHATLVDGVIMPTAASLASTSDAFDYLEDVCDETWTRAFAVETVDDRIRQMEELCTLSAFHQVFARAAGEAMAQWHHISRTSYPMTGEGESHAP